MGVILSRSFAFAVEVVKIHRRLISDHREYVLGKQFLRCGTAIGALVREAQNAESKADFIHKMSIAQKECSETLFWIEIFTQTGYMSQSDSEVLFREATEIYKMITSAILTTKQRYLSQNS